MSEWLRAYDDVLIGRIFDEIWKILSKPWKVYTYIPPNH